MTTPVVTSPANQPAGPAQRWFHQVGQICMLHYLYAILEHIKLVGWLTVN